MNYLENFTRQIAHRVGWTIGNKIENAIWTLVIAFFLLFCCIFSYSAVAFQMVFDR